MESVTRHFRKRGLNRKASRPEIDHNALRLNEMRSFKPFIHCETLRNARFRLAHCDSNELTWRDCVILGKYHAIFVFVLQKRLRQQ